MHKKFHVLKYLQNALMRVLNITHSLIGLCNLTDCSHCFHNHHRHYL